MSRYFTHYWQNSTWRDLQARGDGESLKHIAGNLFKKRGVDVGDVVYVVTVLRGTLFLCGKLGVGKICDVYQAAKDLTVTANLRFVQPKGFAGLKFVLPGYLNQQTMRGVRQLEPSSAAELDSILPAMQVIKRRRPTNEYELHRTDSSVSR
jgi:hypothetical protein